MVHLTLTAVTFPGAAMKLKALAPWKKSYDKPRQCIKKQRQPLLNKGLYSRVYVFSSSHIWIWELDHKKGWVPKNWCFWIVVLEKILECPLDCKKSKPVNPQLSQPWIFIGKSAAKAPILWPRVTKHQLPGKDSDAGKDWRQREKRMAGEEKFNNITLSGHEFEKALGDSGGQRSLACFSPWGQKELDTT